MELKKVSGTGLKAALAVFQRPAVIARKLKISRAAVCHWGDCVPLKRRKALVKEARKLGYELTERQLRGDL